MDAQALVEEFLGSSHGQNARDSLAAQGISAEDATKYLSVAAEQAHAHVSEQGGGGLLGEHVGRNFFAALASGLVKGDGLWGALKDGLEGALGGRVTEALASRLGVDPSTALGHRRRRHTVSRELPSREDGTLTRAPAGRPSVSARQHTDERLRHSRKDDP